MDEAAVRALLKDQSDALHAELHTQLAALHVELQEIKGIGLTRHGAGGGDSGLPRSMRLEVPKFNGIDPERWIFAIHEYFDLLGTAADQRLKVVGFNLEGDAAEWFRWMSRNKLITDWEGFLESVRDRFGPCKYEDPQGALSKLLQLGSVAQYQSDFEKLMNRVTEIPEKLLISFYISGLKPALQRELLVSKPTTLGDAFSLARVTEARFEDKGMAPVSNKAINTSSGGQNQKGTPPRFTFSHPAPSKQALLPTPPKPSSGTTPLAIKWISPAERQERLSKGLCFNCDNKWVRGHKCPGKFLLLMADEVDDADQAIPEAHDEALESGDISILNSLVGHGSPRSLQLWGMIDTGHVHVLIDNGSTHNFVQPGVVERMQLPVTATKPFKVYIGSGETLLCENICSKVLLKMQGLSVEVDLYVLPMKGPDVVLGIQWLQKLGKVTHDYAQQSMEFTFADQTYTLQGDASLRMKQMSLHHMQALLETDEVYGVYELHSVAVQDEAESTQVQAGTSHLEIEQLLVRFEALFQVPLLYLRIDLLMNVRPYRYPHYQKSEMEKLVNEMLSQGIIRYSNSPFSSPVLLVKKKDGSYRFCVDYRALNAVTVKDKFPIPTADEMFDELGSAVIFTKLDLRAGYHQIRVNERDVYKTAFRTHDGHFEFLDHQFYVKRSKCVFGATTLEYLGHIISGRGVEMDPKKVAAIVNWPVPKTQRQVRGFLGLAGYYRRFIKDYASIAGPLSNLLQKDAFKWGAVEVATFEALKHHLSHAPILGLPNFDETFIVETDASATGIGAVLLQKEQPLSFFSRKLGPRMRIAATYEKELFAIVEAIYKWRQYLIGRRFIIRTDHKSIKELMQQVIQTPLQQKYVRKLMGFDFNIEYKPGVSNQVADALSRMYEADEGVIATFMAMSQPLVDFLAELRGENEGLEELQRLHQKIDQREELIGFRREQGLLIYQDRYYIGAESKLKRALMSEFHDTPSAGHGEIKKMLVGLSVLFFWKGMRKSVEEYVKQCLVCQQTKYATQAPGGLLQPLPTPTAVWEDVSMDFITGLPVFKGLTVILVVVDRFSKYAHFGTLPTSFNAPQVAELFVEMVVKHHGFPRTVVSDRDPIFVSKFWKHMFEASGTKLNHSTAYHPQTDGQTEVVNRGLKQYLRAMVSNRPQQWVKFLSWAEYCYNTSYHSSIKMSPFQALYGRLPPAIIPYAPGSSKVAAVDEVLTEQEELLRKLRNNLLAAKHRMEMKANHNRRDVEFKQGDMVFVKLQPYRQVTLAKRLSNKLAKRYYGPFKVLERVGKVAYRLALPSTSKIHPVFHVSLLKPFEGTEPEEVSNLPEDVYEGYPVEQPLSICDSQVVLKNGLPARQVLVQWLGSSPEEATWEWLTDFQAAYPTYHLEDKVISEEEGNVTPTLEGIGRARTKRVTSIPAWQKDYHMG
ncbi:ty3-gypsy retrotransposon protein [Tanacetum coccineum]